MAYVQALFNTTYGRYLYSAITGAYSTLLTVANTTGSVTSNVGFARIIYIFNTLDQDVILSFDNGTTDSVFLPAGKSWTCDLSTGNMYFSGVIRVKHAGVAPASGNIACSVVRTKV